MDYLVILCKYLNLSNNKEGIIRFAKKLHTNPQSRSIVILFNPIWFANPYGNIIIHIVSVEINMELPYKKRN